MKLKASGLATAIGSFPHEDPAQICRLILQKLPVIPCWPQLSKRSFKEQMYIQSSEGLPCVVVDEEKEKIYFDTSNDIYDELEKCLTHVISEDIDYFQTSESYAAGLYEMIRLLEKEKPPTVRWVKGQIVGPISFGLTVTDQSRRAIIYNEEIFETVTKSLAMKARWQIQKLKSAHPDVIIFMDEPYLSSFGSAYINIQRDQVVGLITEIIEAIHAEGALAGVHCCGNTDWSILMDTPIDIINFDAYGYFDGMSLYPDKLRGFLQQGGTLAWGIVPTSEAIASQSHDDFLVDMNEKVSALEAKGLDRDLLLSNCIVTPSCGTGTLSVDLAERVLDETDRVSRGLVSKLAI